MEEASTTLGCKYDHLQFFVDDLRPLSHYKAIEDRLNEFARLVPRAEGATFDIAAAREVWRKMGDSADPNAFEVHGRDLVEQMLYGFGDVRTPLPQTVQVMEDLVVDYVFLLSAPASSAQYAHLAGRTGRKGRSGTAVTLPMGMSRRRRSCEARAVGRASACSAGLQEPAGR